MNLTVLAHRGWCEDIARLIVEIMVPTAVDDWVIECIEKGPGRWCEARMFETREERNEEAKEWKHPWVRLHFAENDYVKVYFLHIEWLDRLAAHEVTGRKWQPIEFRWSALAFDTP